MNVDKFFNELNESSWRKNIKFYAERRFDSLIEYLNDNKDEILENIVSDVREIEHMKNEDKEEFLFETFEKWLNNLTRSNISEWIEDDED